MTYGTLLPSSALHGSVLTLWLPLVYTVKPVSNDHLYDKIYYLLFIQ